MKRLLRFRLGRGGAKTIVLALETNADLFLLDDQEARLEAKRLGLKVTGTLGILPRAKILSAAVL